jgi:hypothetical protein
MIQKDVNETKPIKFKPLEFRYLLALIDWRVEYSLLFAWTVLEVQDFTDWQRHSTPGTLSYQPLVLLPLAVLMPLLVLIKKNLLTLTRASRGA